MSEPITAERRTGFLPDVPEDTYHADPGSLSHSGAKLILKAPAQYRWETDNPTPPTPAMEFGTVVHSLVLGVGARFRVVEGGRGRGEREAAARDAGLVPITQEDYDKALAMALAVEKHPEAAALLAMAPDREVSAYAPDPATGVLMRCRYDALGAFGVDLKTTTDATPASFGRTAVAFGYASQAAWYLDVAALLDRPLTAFAFILVDKSPPHLVSVVELGEASIEYGRHRNRRALDTYKRCVESGEWPGFPGYQTVDVPRWALMEEGLT